MLVYVRVKSLRKRRSELLEYRLPDGIGTVGELIEAFVKEEVKRFNEKDTDLPLISVLSAEDIEASSKSGKVAFGRLYSEAKADESIAVNAALSAFRDGLFRILMDETELKSLDEAITIREGAVFTFIRLTFLAGRMW